MNMKAFFTMLSVLVITITITAAHHHYERPSTGRIIRKERDALDASASTRLGGGPGIAAVIRTIRRAPPPPISAFLSQIRDAASAGNNCSYISTNNSDVDITY